MRFTIILVILNCWVTISFGQTIFNIRTMSAAQNDYLGLHVRDALGDTFFNIFTDGSNPVSIYGKNGNYILRYDASDSLTLIYNSANLGVVQAMGADKNGNLFVASQYQQFNFMYTKLNPEGNILWQ